MNSFPNPKGRAAALLGSAFLMSAELHAATVGIGGMVDTGLAYWHTRSGMSASESRLELTESVLDANRTFLYGSEDLSAETRVSFWLEASYASDTGAMKTENTLFDRAAYLYVTNPRWGQLAAGRLGPMRSGGSPLTYYIMAKRTNPFGTGWGTMANPLFALPFYGFEISNTLHYDTPKAGGFQGHLQYSFATTTGDGIVEGKSSADRYASASVSCDGERVNWVFMVDTMNENSSSGSQKDAVSVIFGGNVDFPGAVRLYGWAAWYRDSDSIQELPGFSTDSTLFDGLDEINGYSLALGAKIPACGGSINLYGLYLKADYDDKISPERADVVGRDLKRFGLVAGYEYPLSGRTTLYAAAGWYKDRVELESFKNPSVGQVVAGIHHNF